MVCLSHNHSNNISLLYCVFLGDACQMPRWQLVAKRNRDLFMWSYQFSYAAGIYKDWGDSMLNNGAHSRPLASIKSKYIVNSSQINTSDIILRTQKLRRSLCIEEKHGFLLANEGFSFYRAFTMCFSLKSRQDIFVSIAKPQLEAAVNFVRCEVSA